jgi:CspA family cold shock protein
VAEGVVKWFNEGKGYGYLTVLDLADGDDPRVNHKDVIVRRSDIQTNRWPTLDDGQHVSFAVERTSEGLRAYRVTVLGDSLPEYLTRKLPRPKPGRTPSVPGLIESRPGRERFTVLIMASVVILLIVLIAWLIA